VLDTGVMYEDNRVRYYSVYPGTGYTVYGAANETFDENGATNCLHDCSCFHVSLDGARGPQQQKPDERHRGRRAQMAEDGGTTENVEQNETETVRDQKTMDPGDQHDTGFETYGRQVGMNAPHTHLGN